MIFMLVIDRNKQKLMVMITECNKARGPQKIVNCFDIFTYSGNMMTASVASIGTLRSNLI